MYHIYRFNRFNSFEKKTTHLSTQQPIEITEESWSHNDGDNFEVGAGHTKYVTMKDVQEHDEDEQNVSLGNLHNGGTGTQDDDQVSELPPSQTHINRTHSDESSNGSLDLGNVEVIASSYGSDKSQHSFHAVAGAAFVEDDTIN
eukprot:CAMPEP_0202704656 /NCGR_PEP_ID=MMETSP1385-20130828/17310_1 /ASSEMBLY_ACC=CAM_ASM_000861 /TAXON_ID=933848 /ORGANISM="Elphidium margaritaceum" /LENGTH=143 /DNA_ID=CAMNT_0049362737 /DNA_START=315 /DNA_END=743 /DNA_ORIENTATION=-